MPEERLTDAALPMGVGGAIALYTKVNSDNGRVSKDDRMLSISCRTWAPLSKAVNAMMRKLGCDTPCVI